MSILSQVLRLTLPLIGAITAAVAAFFAPTLPGPLVLDINLVVVSIPIPLKSPLFVRTVLGAVSASLLLFMLCRNYGPFFPTHLKLRTYFDEDGLARAVAYVWAARPDIPLAEDWHSQRVQYLTELDHRMRQQLPHYGPFFTAPNVGRYLRSEGTATHGVEHAGFWQRYTITEVSGNMTHFLTPPGASQEELETRYALCDTGYNVIEPSLREYLRCVTVVRPIMNQSLSCHNRSFYEARIVGVTRVRFFPFVSLDRTVFCAEADKGLVPIAYAVYFPIA